MSAPLPTRPRSTVRSPSRVSVGTTCVTTVTATPITSPAATARVSRPRPACRISVRRAAGSAPRQDAHQNASPANAAPNARVRSPDCSGPSRMTTASASSSGTIGARVRRVRNAIHTAAPAPR